FEKGMGPDIGSAQMVQGEALVVHKGQSVAYKLKKGSPIFAGDMLVTKERSRLNAKMNDKSVIGLAPVSKLVIDKSVYDPKKDERSSFLSLMWGRARFIVSKLTKSKPNYQVKTPTAVCGVRGTDFAIAVSPDGEQFAAFQKSFAPKVSLVSTAHAAAAVPVTVIVVGPNGSVTVKTTLGTTQIKDLQGAFAPEGAAPSGPVPMTLTEVLAALQSVSPELAALSMPPEFD
ncbi:FecR domain-containing protein, partial [Thermodesulfobacteriota bacterium]